LAAPVTRAPPNRVAALTTCLLKMPNPLYVLDLLPALPSEWETGSVTGLCARDGYEVDRSWRDDKHEQAILHAKGGGNLRPLAAD